jgi:hypothetical protein
MKRGLWLFGATLLLLVAATVFAGETAEGKKDACKVLGTCADEAIQAAQEMREECAKMMATAQDLIAKGAQIKARGQIWADPIMVAEGEATIARGQTMLDQAKKMDEQCKIIIDEAKKSKENAANMNKKDDPNKGRTSDDGKLKYRLSD